MKNEVLIINETRQTSCCDSLRSFEGAVSSNDKTALVENVRRYWIKFIPLCYISFSSMTVLKKPSINPSFWNFVESNGTKYPESPSIFNRCIIEIETKISKTFRKGDTAQAVPQATQLRSMTVEGKKEKRSNGTCSIVSKKGMVQVNRFTWIIVILIKD